jgi:hypothetical protein
MPTRDTMHYVTLIFTLFIASGVRSKTKECGIFPSNFVTVLPQRDDVVLELQQILKEWVVLLKDYYRVSFYSVLPHLRIRIYFRRFMHPLLIILLSIARQSARILRFDGYHGLVIKIPRAIGRCEYHSRKHLFKNTAKFNKFTRINVECIL